MPYSQLGTWRWLGMDKTTGCVLSHQGLARISGCPHTHGIFSASSLPTPGACLVAGINSFPSSGTTSYWFQLPGSMTRQLLVHSYHFCISMTANSKQRSGTGHTQGGQLKLGWPNHSPHKQGLLNYLKKCTRLLLLIVWQPWVLCSQFSLLSTVINSFQQI